MSRQRKKHTNVVQRQKIQKSIRRGRSCREGFVKLMEFVESMKLEQGVTNWPPYRGTKCRGRWR